MGTQETRKAYCIVRFHEEEYLLVNGALTTADAFSKGEASFAHVYRDGVVRRYGEEIGRVEEIEVLREAPKMKIEDDWFANVLLSPTWRRP